ncbi:FecR family protein [Sphaerotilus natans]|uniref:FecR domain-containing protein n=1 Tax=Sphaerotilus natans TaxID=34103 RepID=UPI00095754B7|nr:FecR domain-containing protein [Sphaerotilus natans]SIR67006.1 FecR family protein [Sphaerotilus natans]
MTLLSWNAVGWGRALQLAAIGLTMTAGTVSGRAPQPAAADLSAGEPVFTHVVTREETLIALSRRLLADPRQWPQLQRHNRIVDPRRIPVGTVLKIPLRLLATEPASARVLSAAGAVTGPQGAAVAAGQALPQGARLLAGDDGQATLQLVDGTVLRLRAGSAVQIETSRRLPRSGDALSGVKVEDGQVEVQAQKRPGAGAPGFQISTPQGLLGVRGTEFRVSVDTQAQATRNEVLEGQVMTEGRDGRAGRSVAAGFGVVVDRSGAVTLPVRLLAAPDVSAWPVLHDQLLVRFAVAAQSAAVAFRGQVAAASDPQFDRVLADVRTEGAELRFAGLPDGHYRVRVRAEGPQGLQGLDARHAFTLKARPEPPLPILPGAKAVLSGQRLQLAWATVEEARSYRLQLARSEDFSAPLQDRRGLTEPTLTLDGLDPGAYFWRVASERSATDQGPFGAAHRVELRPLPAPPPPPRIDEDGVRLAWEGQPGQSFDIEFARDPAFAVLALARRVEQPVLSVKMPGTGRYYLRLRARDADGFVGPYTAPQAFTVPNCLRDGQQRCVGGADGGLVLIAP